MQQDFPLKVRLFYTRQPFASAAKTAAAEIPHVPQFSLGVGGGRISRNSILDGVGGDVAARIGDAVVLISGPSGRDECALQLWMMFMLAPLLHCARARARACAFVCVSCTFASAGFVEAATTALKEAGVPSERVVCLD